MTRPSFTFDALNCTTRCGYLYSLLYCPVFTNLSFHISSNRVLPAKSQLNWEMPHGNFDLLARVLLSGPQSTSLSFSPEKTIWYLEMVTTASPLPPLQPYYSLHMHTNGSHLSFRLKLFSMGNKPKMFGPFLFFDGKISLIYHERLFLDSLNERLSWPTTNTSFSGVVQTQSHSTSFKWHMGKEKELAFMECLLCFGHITVIKSWDLCSNPLKLHIIIPHFLGEKTETRQF